MAKGPHSPNWHSLARHSISCVPSFPTRHPCPPSSKFILHDHSQKSGCGAKCSGSVAPQHFHLHEILLLLRLLPPTSSSFPKLCSCQGGVFPPLISEDPTLPLVALLSGTFTVPHFIAFPSLLPHTQGSAVSHLLPT